MDTQTMRRVFGPMKGMILAQHPLSSRCWPLGIMICVSGADIWFNVGKETTGRF